MEPTLLELSLAAKDSLRERFDSYLTRPDRTERVALETALNAYGRIYDQILAEDHTKYKHQAPPESLEKALTS